MGFHKFYTEFKDTKCCRCDSTLDLEVHHVDENYDMFKFSDKYPKLVTFCSKCHHELHTLQRKIEGVGEKRIYLSDEVLGKRCMAFIRFYKEDRLKQENK